MMSKANRFLWVTLAALLALGVVFWITTVGRSGDESNDTSTRHDCVPPQGVQTTQLKGTAEKPDSNAKKRGVAKNDVARATDLADRQEEASSSADEGKGEIDEAEALVEAFDSLTDKWMEPSEKGVTMEDVQHFAEQFRKLPTTRKNECLQRALNLVPDENVMLLAGVLMDKTQDKEYLEMVYNNVLNRDENVKKPILQQIFKDREHPCWADTAWILDVTGEKPAKTNKN